MSQRAGRDLEKLIAYLEEFAGPKGMTVTSPDYIMGKLSGSWREVDATLRYSIGSSEVLIALECRKRTDVQDVTWIEQLASKREDIDADVIVAVSSSPFTKGAVEFAEGKKVQLRRLEAFAPGGIEKWFGMDHIMMEERLWHIDDATIILEGYDKEKGKLAGHEMEMDEPLFRRASDGTMVSMFDILSTTNLNSQITVGIDIPEIVHKPMRLKLDADDEQYSIQGDGREYRLKEISFHATLVRSISKSPLKDIQRYSDPESGKMISSVANFPFPIQGNELLLRLIKDEKTGQQSVVISNVGVKKEEE
ncbi:MAG: restriction endonuclease [Planctomycetes bacterium]|nr:restriction endonuclease [Planctomycetota bacterium]